MHRLAEDPGEGMVLAYRGLWPMRRQEKKGKLQVPEGEGDQGPAHSEADLTLVSSEHFRLGA